MDIFAIKPVTVKVDIINPGTGDATGLVIEVISQESPEVKKVLRRQIDKTLKRRGKPVTAVQLEDDMTERLAAAVVGWEWKGDASAGGKKLEFTPENVEKVLGVAWIRSQVREVVENEAEFFTA